MFISYSNFIFINFVFYMSSDSGFSLTTDNQKQKNAHLEAERKLKKKLKMVSHKMTSEKIQFSMLAWFFSYKHIFSFYTYTTTSNEIFLMIIIMQQAKSEQICALRLWLHYTIILTLYRTFFHISSILYFYDITVKRI